jgi:hypothetical protein
MNRIWNSLYSARSKRKSGICDGCYLTASNCQQLLKKHVKANYECYYQHDRGRRGGHRTLDAPIKSIDRDLSLPVRNL